MFISLRSPRSSLHASPIATQLFPSLQVGSSPCVSSSVQQLTLTTRTTEAITLPCFAYIHSQKSALFRLFSSPLLSSDDTAGWWYPFQKVSSISFSQFPSTPPMIQQTGGIHSKKVSSIFASFPLPYDAILLILTLPMQLSLMSVDSIYSLTNE